MSKTEEEMRLRNIYRISKLGESLAMTLDTLVDEKKISGSLAVGIINQFDISIYEALNKRTCAKMSLKGQVKKYTNAEGIWQYYVENARLMIEAEKDEFKTKDMILLQTK